MKNFYTDTRAVAILTAISIFALYNNWVATIVVSPGLSLPHSLISEISASSQPYHAMFRTSDIAAGIVTLALLPWVWRFTAKDGRRYAWLVATCFALIGVGSIIDAALAVQCAPSQDVHCNLGSSGSWITSAHLYESTITGVITLAAPVLWWRWHKDTDTWLARISMWFVWFQLGIGVLIIAGKWSNYDIVGLWQRLYELAIGIWIAVVTATVLWRPKHTIFETHYKHSQEITT